MRKQITPCLWFNNQAKEAAAFYCEQFVNAKIVAQSAIVSEIEAFEQHFILLDGGPMYKPNPSVSFFYTCETEEEIDRIWAAFTKEGQILMPLDTYPWSKKYGWASDKYGVSWQFSLGKLEDVGQKITPSFLFAGKQYGRAEEAISHYSEIFKNSSLDGVLRYGSNEAPDVEGKVKHAQFSLNGQKFMATDSAHAHQFTFTEGVSLTIYCDTQEEIDYYWQKLTENGGEESMCGWLKDKFGLSWQVIPSILSKLLSDPDKAGKAVQAFMQMRKFDIEKLVQASLS
jgi:predicted 3-demethylubiquinone-9 3-methyltransferase (glyoxalase superfamily)